MSLKIISADERAAKPSAIKGVIGGPSGIGKTTLAWTLDPETTLFIDAEAGMLALEGWSGDSIDINDEATRFGVHPWEMSRAIASMLSGPVVGHSPEQAYSQPYYNYWASRMGDPAGLFGKYRTIFVDSITVASRHAFHWSKQQPQAFAKTGAADTRGAYGLMGSEMIEWLTVLQHTSDKNVWLVGILEQKEDDVGRKSWGFQVEGGKTMRELPGIVDQVITMAEVDFGPETGKHRAFVCHTLNPWDYPAKDRSRRLDAVEPPHLGQLMNKIKNGAPNTTLVTTL